MLFINLIKGIIYNINNKAVSIVRLSSRKQNFNKFIIELIELEIL